MYRLLFRLLLVRLDPERAHAYAWRSLRGLRSTSAGRALLRRMAGAIDPALRTTVLGLSFPTPVGVAAGVDKDATWFEDLAALGFGFVEVGTITSRSQAGNARPRVARWLENRALINRMGFPNAGAESAVPRLERRPDRPVVGVNVGKHKSVALEEAPADYAAAIRALAPLADYLVINVSSPNTPGLRDMQTVDQLRPLITAARGELAQLGRPELPLLIKIAPDLSDDQLTRIARFAVEERLDGIVAVNTTVDRSGLSTDRVGFEGGGVSGPPLARRALAVLRRLRELVGDALVLVSVGGIETADDVLERIRAGASLVQVYTGFVYGGPGWPARINRELAAKVRAAGVDSIGELVGSAAAPPAPSAAAQPSERQASTTRAAMRSEE